MQAGQNESCLVRVLFASLVPRQLVFPAVVPSVVGVGVKLWLGVAE